MAQQTKGFDLEDLNKRMNGAVSTLKHEFAGRVNGSSIEGSVTLTGNRMQGQYEWNAARGVK